MRPPNAFPPLGFGALHFEQHELFEAAAAGAGALGFGAAAAGAAVGFDGEAA